MGWNLFGMISPVEALRERIRNLERDLDRCQSEKAVLRTKNCTFQEENVRLRTQIQALETKPAPAALNELPHEQAQALRAFCDAEGPLIIDELRSKTGVSHNLAVLVINDLISANLLEKSGNRMLGGAAWRHLPQYAPTQLGRRLVEIA